MNQLLLEITKRLRSEKLSSSLMRFVDFDHTDLNLLIRVAYNVFQ